MQGKVQDSSGSKDIDNACTLVQVAKKKQLGLDVRLSVFWKQAEKQVEIEIDSSK